MAPTEKHIYYDYDDPNDHVTSLPVQTRRTCCNLKCLRQLFYFLATLGMLAMLGYIVFNTAMKGSYPVSSATQQQSANDVTRELSLFREELKSVKNELEKMPSLPHQREKMDELVSKLTTITQQLDSLSRLNQKVTNMTEELAKTKNQLTSANEKLDGIEVINQNLNSQSQERDELRNKMNDVSSKTDSLRDSMAEIKREILRTQSLLHEVGNGSQSMFKANGMIHVCWIAALYLFVN